jgi:hypothetical protein
VSDLDTRVARMGGMPNPRLLGTVCVCITSLIAPAAEPPTRRALLAPSVISRSEP